MPSKIRTPASARQRTGTVEPFTRADGTLYYRGKVRLADGSRERVDIDPPHCFDVDASRVFVRETQAQADVHGRLLARKRGAPDPVTTETVSQWVDRWLEWRSTRGLSSTPHDKGRLRGYVLPVLGPLAMRAVARRR